MSALVLRITDSSRTSRDVCLVPLTEVAGQNLFLSAIVRDLKLTRSHVTPAGGTTRLKRDSEDDLRPRRDPIDRGAAIIRPAKELRIVDHDVLAIEHELHVVVGITIKTETIGRLLAAAVRSGSACEDTRRDSGHS